MWKAFYTYHMLTVSGAPHSLVKMSLYLESLPFNLNNLTFLVGQGYWEIHSALVCLEKVYLPSFLFLWTWNFKLTSFFLSTLWRRPSIVFWLALLLMRSQHHLYLCSPVCNVSVFLLNSYSSLLFISLIMTCFGVVGLVFWSVWLFCICLLGFMIDPARDSGVGTASYQRHGAHAAPGGWGKPWRAPGRRLHSRGRCHPRWKGGRASTAGPQGRTSAAGRALQGHWQTFQSLELGQGGQGQEVRLMIDLIPHGYFED